MRLRLGDQVHADDGPFGTLSDIVVDPQRRVITHLVVDPQRQHLQARLVPIWLTSVVDDVIRVGLDTEHVRQLKLVCTSDFVRLGEQLDLGPDWDVGVQDVAILPYLDIEFSPSLDDQILVRYDRVPKGDCEIRRLSKVISSDDDCVGHVEGFLAEDESLSGVIVRTGRMGIHHYVVVPMSSVAKVATDRIDLVIDRKLFEDLPTAPIPDEHDGPTSRLTELQRRAGAATSKLAARSRWISARARDGVDH